MRIAANLLLSFGLIAVLMAWGAQSPSAVYGPRHQLHKTVRECARCHVAWAPVEATTCSAGVCHADLGTSIVPKTPRQKFHVVVRATTCRRCHPEHKGPAGKARFHHGLVPSKMSARCQDCHAMPAKLRDGKAHPPDRPDGCVACHTSDTNWRRVVTPK